MTYTLLGQDLHETADRAKVHFAQSYGATRFSCEQPIEDLPLRPTWQAVLKAGYTLCINVQPTPFSPTLHEFVNQCASRGLPIKLWVAVPHDAPKESFGVELRQAHEVGAGVLQIPENGDSHEFHRAVPLSLFALKKTDLTLVPRARREVLKEAQSTFLDGTPDKGCQEICQELEHLTRQFAELTHDNGWWSSPRGSSRHDPKFFAKSPWAGVLEELERRLDVSSVKSKCASFSRQLIVKARAYTEWRNDLSHKPRNSRELMKRDAKLRTMFEATRDLLIEWLPICNRFRLLK